MKTKIAIIIEDGYVVGINSSNKDVEYVIVDHGAFDRGQSPVSSIKYPSRTGENIYELYDSYSPVQDAEVCEQLKRLKF